MKKKVVKKKRRTKLGSRTELKQLVLAILEETKEESRKVFIGVVFPSSDKMYTYKIKRNHKLVPGDYVIAPGGGICKVVRAHAAPVPGLRDDEYKEITRKVVTV